MNTNRTGWEADSNGYSTTVDNDSRVMVRDDDKGREVTQWQREGGGELKEKLREGVTVWGMEWDGEKAKVRVTKREREEDTFMVYEILLEFYSHYVCQ